MEKLPKISFRKQKIRIKENLCDHNFFIKKLKKEREIFTLVRGYQRKIIFLKNTGSSFFDEAYFVISQKYEKEKTEKNELICEANRIIEQNICEEDEILKKRKSERIKKSFFEFMKNSVIPFLLGAVFAFIVVLFTIRI